MIEKKILWIQTTIFVVESSSQSCNYEYCV
jgi:hypothetical protein